MIFLKRRDGILVQEGKGRDSWRPENKNEANNHIFINECLGCIKF